MGAGRGYALTDAAHYLAAHAEIHAFDLQREDDSIGWMRFRLQLSSWIIASMFASVMERKVRAMQPPPVSRFGRLSHGELGRTHAVVLVGADRERLYCLDPYYSAAGQPLAMTNEDCAEAFQLSAFAVRVG